MKTLTVEEIIVILNAGEFDQLKDAVENDRFECKAEPYRLDEEHQKYELAKDVSALANAKGGIILIGAQTERDPTHATDVIVKIRPLPNNLVKISQYEDIVRTWVYPPVKDIEIKWFKSSTHPATGLVGITIPEQEALWRPFLMTRSIEPSGRVSTTLFGYAERGNGKSLPMSVQQLHTILRDGYRVGTGAFGPLTTSPQERSGVKPTELIAERIGKAVEAAELLDRPLFVLAAVPQKQTDLSVLLSARDAEPVKLLEHPTELRQSGFGPGAGINSRIVEGKCRRAVLPKYKLLEVWIDGSVIMIAAGDADFLSWGNRSSDSLRINQLALIECTYLFARLAKDFLAFASSDFTSLDYVLSVQRMKLEHNCYLFPGPLTQFPHGGIEAPEPDFKTVITEPPMSDPGIPAYRLVSHVYNWFGFENDKIPYTSINKEGKWIIDPAKIIDLNKRVF